jgi:type I restriction enzyme S subunit
MRFLDYVSVNPKISLEKERIYPFVEMGDVSTSFRNPDKVEYKSFDSGVKFADGDTVIARITPCLQNGKRFYCKNIGKGFGSTEYLVFRPKDSSVDNLYLYYFMNTDFIKESMVRSMVGATGRQRVNNDVFSRLDVTFPNIEIQRRIAEILSTYDDLIENNRKQIKLLEEAAQRLYKEWFVDLRFPGHENTKITDGVPEGWRKYKFSDTTSIMGGGTPKTDVKEFYNGNIPFYTPKDSDDSFFAFDTITHISQSGLDNCNSQLYPVNTIIITARGTVGKTTILAVPMAMNQSCYALKCDELNSPYYLFFSLKNEVAALKTMSNGGVFNTIIVKTFDSICLIAPTQDVLNMFEASVSPIMEQIKTKARQNIILTEARDRLLPKLMSGEIEL